MYVCMCVCMYVSVYLCVCVYVYMYICMYVYVCYLLDIHVLGTLHKTIYPRISLARDKQTNLLLIYKFLE